MVNGAGDPSVIPGRELQWKSRSLQPIDPSRIRRWEQSLSKAQIAQVERIAGNKMLELDYEPVSPPPYHLHASDLLPYAFDLGRMACSLTHQCLQTEIRYALSRLRLPTRKTSHGVSTTQIA